MFRKILLILLLAMSFRSFAQTPQKPNLWNRIDDDTKHVYAGVAITTITGGLTYKYTKKIGLSMCVGFLSGVAAGIIKESVWDGMMHKGVVSNKDAGLTMWGAGVGTFCLRIGIDVHERKKVEEEQYQDLKVKKILLD